MGKGGVLEGVSECTAHICQDHSQTPTLSLAARECERPMIASVRFQQTHMALTLAGAAGAALYMFPGRKMCRCNLMFSQRLWMGEVTTEVGCLFRLAATAPYLPDDVTFGLLWNRSRLLRLFYAVQSQLVPPREKRAPILILNSEFTAEQQ